VENLTISDYLDMQETYLQNWVRLKTHLFFIPNPLLPAPILRIDQGILAFKDLSSLGYLATNSKTEIAFTSTYTACDPSDIGKQVKINGAPIPNLVLAGYNNTADANGRKKWWLSGSTSVPSGSQMTIDGGTGAGTSSLDSMVYGGGAIKIGHGLTGPTDPPKISLMDSEQGYDTLNIRKTDGNTPAHLDLGNLTAHGNLTVEGDTVMGNVSVQNGCSVAPVNDNNSFIGTSQKMWQNVWTRNLQFGVSGSNNISFNIDATGLVLSFDTSSDTGGIVPQYGTANPAKTFALGSSTNRC
jgi:hypothetical protein